MPADLPRTELAVPGRPAAFTVDPACARQLLNRAVRRHQGLPVGAQEAAFDGEDLTLDPGWALDSVRGTAGTWKSPEYGDLGGDIACLLSQALRAGAITSSVGGAGIGFAAGPGGRFRWLVFLGRERPFALCSRADEEMRTLGREAGAGRDAPEGIRAALAILHHAADAASGIIAAYSAALLPQAGRRVGSAPRPQLHEVTLRLDDRDRPLPATVTADAVSTSDAIARAAVAFTFTGRLARGDARIVKVDKVVRDGQDIELT